MARYYDALLDYGDAGVATASGLDYSDIDTVQVSPFAVVAVWRYRYPVTFSRQQGNSFSKDPNDGTQLRDPVLIIVEDIQNLQVTSSKASHVTQMQGTLLNGANYMVEMFPGDWCAAWMVNNAKIAQDLINRIKDGKPCNQWGDGLKFLGRISAIHKRIQQTPGGPRNTTYNFNAAGFTELDASIYYEPYLASQSVGIATDWLRSTGIELNNIIINGGGDPNQGYIDVNKLLPMLLHAFYGSGVPKNSGFAAGPVGGADQEAGLDNPNAMVIPDAVAAVFNIQNGTKPNGKKSWTDLCNLITGIQKYKLSQTSDNTSTQDVPVAGYSNKTAGAIFTPDGVSGTPGTKWYQCPDPLLGTFLPSLPQFNGQKTVWSILQQFQNPAVNEMFTCLRADPGGDVYPTLIVRQLPFTSGILDETYKPRPVKSANDSPKQKQGKDRQQNQDDGSNAVNNPRQLQLTRFGELPRWIIPPLLIRSVDLGRSDSLRFNFVHVYGETGLQSQNRTGYIVRDPPITDDLDIMRSGLRPYMMTVNCSRADAESRKAGDWMYILSDILMGQHLTLTGTMEMVGMQAPIAPGDNIEFDAHVLHIEAISHSFVMQTGSGQKSFTTSLALSHGLKADQLTGGDFAMFSGTSSHDLRKFEPSTSRDYRVNRDEPNSPPDAGIASPVPTAVTATPTDNTNQAPNSSSSGVDADALVGKIQDSINKKTWGF